MSNVSVALRVEPEVPHSSDPRPPRRIRRAELLQPELVRAALWQ